VPNLFAPSVNEFDPTRRATSGNPEPQFSNESADLLLPASASFDSSQNLWVNNCGLGTIVEFTSAQLANLGVNPAPTPNTTVTEPASFGSPACPWGAQFDVAGNLWITNRPAFSPITNLVAYTPAQLSAGGTQTPGTIITSSSFADLRATVFDASANLWMVENASQKILGYKAATLATAMGHSGVVDPDIVISSTSFVDPRGLAFDASANLWISDATGELFKFASASLGASGSLMPTVTIAATIVITADGFASSLDNPDGLAFDPSGNLWVSNLESDNAGSIAEFTAAQLATSGSPSPAVFLDSDIFGININLPALLTFGPIP
jgi:streptogramin lyase